MITEFDSVKEKYDVTTRGWELRPCEVCRKGIIRSSNHDNRGYRGTREFKMLILFWSSENYSHDVIARQSTIFVCGFYLT